MKCEICDATLSGFEEDICANCAMEEIVSDANYTKDSIGRMKDMGYTQTEIWAEIAHNPHINIKHVKHYFDLEHFWDEQNRTVHERIGTNLQTIEQLAEDLVAVSHSATKNMIKNRMDELRSWNAERADYLAELAKQIQDYK